MKKSYMDRYTIPCTEEQTKIALSLGAPIQLWSEYHENQEHDFKLDTPIPCEQFTNGYCSASCPTTEQMIGWLEENNIETIIVCKKDGGDYGYTVYHTSHRSPLQRFWFSTRKEATLAAIDATLKYLITSSKI